MKDKIVDVLEAYEFKMTIDEDGGLVFEGPMVNQDTLDEIAGKLFSISNDLDLMLFQIDDNTLMIAVFYELPMV